VSQNNVRAVLIEELGSIAPEADFQHLDPKADLREALDIDSMDILTLVTALHRRLGVDIPELDYPKLNTTAGAVEYLEAALAKKRAAGRPDPSGIGP
jgi:acyl carrier protein